MADDEGILIPKSLADERAKEQREKLIRERRTMVLPVVIRASEITGYNPRPALLSRGEVEVLTRHGRYRVHAPLEVIEAWRKGILGDEAGEVEVLT